MDILKARKKAKDIKRNRENREIDDSISKAGKKEEEDAITEKEPDERLKKTVKKKPGRKGEKTGKKSPDKQKKEPKIPDGNTDEEEEFRRQIVKELEKMDTVQPDLPVKASPAEDAVKAMVIKEDDVYQYKELFQEYEEGEEVPALEKKEDMVKFLVFRIGREYYSIDIMKIKKIDPVEEITRVPNTPPFVLGVISLRGEIIPILDLKKKLMIKEHEGIHKPGIVILNELNAGIIIDYVVGVREIKLSEIEKAPSIVGSIDSEYITGIVRYKKIVFSILDINNLIRKEIVEGIGDFFSRLKL